MRRTLPRCPGAGAVAKYAERTHGPGGRACEAPTRDRPGWKNTPNEPKVGGRRHDRGPFQSTQLPGMLTSRTGTAEREFPNPSVGGLTASDNCAEIGLSQLSEAMGG